MFHFPHLWGRKRWKWCPPPTAMGLFWILNTLIREVLRSVPDTWVFAEYSRDKEVSTARSHLRGSPCLNSQLPPQLSSYSMTRTINGSSTPLGFLCLSWLATHENIKNSGQSVTSAARWYERTSKSFFLRLQQVRYVAQHTICLRDPYVKTSKGGHIWVIRDGIERRTKTGAIDTVQCLLQPQGIW